MPRRRQGLIMSELDRNRYRMDFGNRVAGKIRSSEPQRTVRVDNIFRKGRVHTEDMLDERKVAAVVDDVVVAHQ